MTIFEFVEELCDVIAGEDGYYNYSKEELIQLCKEMSTSAQEWNDLQEIKIRLHVCFVTLVNP